MAEKLEISWESILRFFAVGAALLILYYFRDLIAVFVSAAIIATAVDAPVSFLMKFRIPRFAAVTLVYLAGLAVIAGTFYFLAPIIVSQVQDMIRVIVDFLNRLRVSVIIPNLRDILQIFSNNISGVLPSIGQGTGQALAFFSGIIGSALYAILVFIVSFYLALQEKWVDKVLRLIAPSRYEDYLINLWSRSERKIGRWFYAQIMLALVVGVPVYISLSIMGVNYALILGMVAAVFEIVPVVGPVFAGIIAFIIAVHQGLDLGIYTVILFVAIQQLENHIFVPMLMKKSLGLNPVVVIFSLLVGAKLAGFWGVIIAVPIAAAASEFFLDLEKRRNIVRA